MNIPPWSSSWSGFHGRNKSVPIQNFINLLLSSGHKYQEAWLLSGISNINERKRLQSQEVKKRERVNTFQVLWGCKHGQQDVRWNHHPSSTQQSSSFLFVPKTASPRLSISCTHCWPLNKQTKIINKTTPNPYENKTRKLLTELNQWRK